MTFLAMIAALVLLKIWGSNNPVQRDAWFGDLQGFTRGLGFSPAVGAVIYIGMPVLLTELVLGMVSSLMFGLFWIAAAAGVLLYSFGRVDLDALADHYRSYCLNGDFEGAYLYAQAELGMEAADVQLDSPADVHMAIQRELLYIGYQRWFAVLFYFVLLGPAWALAYRLLQLSRPTAEGGQIARLLYFVDWIPARLLAAGFALTGDFIASRDELVDSFSGGEQSAGSILLEVGRAAIGSPESPDTASETSFSDVAAAEISDLRALLSRSAGIWLIAISMMVLFL